VNKEVQVLFYNVAYNSRNSIRSPLDMTYILSTVSYKVGDVMSIISHTNITVMFRRFNFVKMEQFICCEKQANLCAIHSATETTFVQI